MSSHQNRRSHPRVKANSLASHYRAKDKMALGHLVENISQGGLFVRTADPLPLSTPLALELVRPGLKKAIRVQGKVVNVVTPELAKAQGVAPGMGIRFDALASDVSERLGSLLSEFGLSPPASGAGPDVDVSRRAAFDFGFVSLENIDGSADSVPLVTDQKKSKAPSAAAPKQAPAPTALTSAPPASVGTVVAPESARLMVQVRGLLQQMGELQLQLDAKTREADQLREEVSRLKVELSRRAR